MFKQMSIVEDNGRSVEVDAEELETLSRLVTRGEDGNFHPNGGVAWEQIENALQWHNCATDGD